MLLKYIFVFKFIAVTGVPGALVDKVMKGSGYCNIFDVGKTCPSDSIFFMDGAIITLIILGLPEKRGWMKL